MNEGHHGFALALLFATASTALADECCIGPIVNGGFEFARTCPWEGRAEATDTVPPTVIRLENDGCSSSCSYLQLVANDETPETVYAEVTQDLTISANDGDWAFLEFCARVDDPDGVFGSRANVDFACAADVHNAQIFDTDDVWVTIKVGFELTQTVQNEDLLIRFWVCGTGTSDLTMDIDNVSVRLESASETLCDGVNPATCGQQAICNEGGNTAGIDNADPCLPGDANGDGEVDFEDIMAILTDWGDTACTRVDVDASGEVDFGDITTVIANWTGADELEDVVEDMDLTWPDDWDDFEDCIENGTAAEQDNCSCWMQHYYDVHYLGTCLCSPNCPDDDPWGNH